MKNSIFTVTENQNIARGTFRMRLSGDTGEMRPGQFVNIKLDGLYLRRPISVCDAENGILTIVFKTVGRGTEKLASAEPGEKFDLLTGLGNGYDLSKSGEKPLLIGGGAGVPPLYMLAKKLVEAGKRPFSDLGCAVTVTTADGSRGVKGFVADALPAGYDYFYTCGPEPMLRAVYKAARTSGQFSFEERMGCGFGACMGCSCRTVTGYKRICKDGPVLEKEEILWKD